MRNWTASFDLIGPFTLVLLSLAACDGAGGGSGGGGSGDTNGGGGSGADTAAGGGGSAPEPAHALGVITLGETHAAVSGEVFPLVSASFLPNTEGGGAPSCATEIAGCKVTVSPQCGVCDAGYHCAFDASCVAVCQKLCDAPCGPDEECYFPSPDAPACRKKESFDAGALTFTGTTVPITLFPPYSFAGAGNGAPFAEGAALGVQASGASGAGFEPFGATFTATRLLQTSPSLATISVGQALGAGDLPVSWVPGEDRITITAVVTASGGKSGTVTCEASDQAGSHSIPRQALLAAGGGGDLSGMTLSITRSRTETTKDLKTKGSLTATKVEAVGWVNLTTSTSETASYVCPSGMAVCGDECVSLQSDHDNCGACGVECAAGDFCNVGTCVGTTACNGCINDSMMSGGGCKDEFDACMANPACNALLDCLDGCATQSCVNGCFDANEGGIAGQQAIASCVCFDECSQECSNSC